ncbi:hypothetical protein AVEN_61841-1 [Araneus ventricosus]|uniref:Uncharacterized protein n=1 Tax=Araneus ventricosus TaxID=182803 RepID=A0A4Y2QY18_ARAVE|nr:hypothetical protein AVEN_61841-1 [Araneus ventricosus]
MGDSQTETFKDSWPLDERETEALMDFLPVQSQFFKSENDFDAVLQNDEVVDETVEENPKESLAVHETSSESNGQPQQKIMNMKWNPKSLSAQLEIPSREKFKRWIYADIPKDKKIDRKTIGYRKIGKWLLFLDKEHRCKETGMTLHDYAWQFVEELTKNGTFFDAKCSTAMEGVSEAIAPKSHKGVICCYTPDYTNKQDVKRAADAIRRAVHYPFVMYYKTDKDTAAMNYAHTGQKHISTYKHTGDRKMYERDSVIKFKWNLVDV